MKLDTLKCINCGSSLEVEDGINTFFCKYCGHKIILGKLSEASINAKIQIKKMEHSERMTDRQYEQQRYNLEKKEQHKNNEISRNLIIVLIIMSVGVLLFAGIIGIAYVSSIREEKKLEAKVNEIMMDINTGDYNEAYIKANSLYYTSGWSNKTKKKWDNTRKALLKKIKQTEKKSSDNKDGSGFFNWFK